MSFIKHAFSLAAFAGLLSTASAQQIQQVSCTSDGCGTVGCAEEGCNSKSKRDRCRTADCNSCDACDGVGRCSLRNRMDAFALDWCAPCGPIGCPAGKGCPVAQKVHWHCTTKAFPDSGWAPPARMPVTRSGAAYTAYNNWGMGGYGPAAPMVYQPTDTAQLGYSYAHVPTWRPNPNMIPRVPNPSNFHARFCPGQTMGHCDMGHYDGMVVPEMMPSACPACDSGYQEMGYIGQKIAPAATRPVVARIRPKSTPTQKEAKIQQTASRQSKAASVRPATQSRPKTTTRSAGTPTQRPARRTTNQPQATGWFGLPSLKDMKF